MIWAGFGVVEVLLRDRQMHRLSHVVIQMHVRLK